MSQRTSLHEQPLDTPRLLATLVRHWPEWAKQLAGVTTRQEFERLTHTLLSQLLDQVHGQPVAPDDLTQRLQRFIVVHLERGPTLKDLAKYLGYSEKYCSDLFYARMGECFSRYLKRLRLEKARQLLRDTNATLSEVAATLGFCDQYAFSHFFKRASGYSPKQFREMSR